MLVIIPYFLVSVNSNIYVTYDFLVQDILTRGVQQILYKVGYTRPPSNIYRTTYILHSFAYYTLMNNVYYCIFQAITYKVLNKHYT